MWKLFHRVRGRRSNGQSSPPDTTSISGWPSLSKPPSREDVILGYRVVLGRDPESEAIIAEKMQHPTLASFRMASLKSKEFRGQYVEMFAAEAVDPNSWAASQTLVFIHMQKTGGTSLRTLLERHYAKDKVCPLRFNLYALSVSELAQFDFFCGHFDFSTLQYLPRKRALTITVFREPRNRLISMYRFHKSHPPRDEFTNNRFVRLANDLSAEEFFEHPEIRQSPEVFNNYLLTFGRSYWWFVANRNSLNDAELDDAAEDAKKKILQLAAFGITERFEHSTEYIFDTLKIQRPNSIESIHVTDDFPKIDTRFQKVAPVAITPRLAAALEDLTKYDDDLYRFAALEFDRRYVAMKSSQ